MGPLVAVGLDQVGGIVGFGCGIVSVTRAFQGQFLRVTAVSPTAITLGGDRHRREETRELKVHEPSKEKTDASG